MFNSYIFKVCYEFVKVLIELLVKNEGMSFVECTDESEVSYFESYFLSTHNFYRANLSLSRVFPLAFRVAFSP